jgi:hypothetical protein
MAARIQGLVRGRQGRIKSSYFMLLKQLEEMDQEERRDPTDSKGNQAKEERISQECQSTSEEERKEKSRSGRKPEAPGNLAGRQPYGPLTKFETWAEY